MLYILGCHSRSGTPGAGAPPVGVHAPGVRDGCTGSVRPLGGNVSGGARTWEGGNEVGSGRGDFQHVFCGGAGIIHTVTRTGIPDQTARNAEHRRGTPPESRSNAARRSAPVAPALYFVPAPVASRCPSAACNSRSIRGRLSGVLARGPDRKVRPGRNELLLRCLDHDARALGRRNDAVSESPRPNAAPRPGHPSRQRPTRRLKR